MIGRPRVATTRTASLIGLSLVAYVVMAGPMIVSELAGFGYAATMRVVLGLIGGGLGAPMFVAAMWRKPTLAAFASITLPPAGAAVLAAWSWSDDYSFTHIAVPLSYITVPLTFFVVPDRDDTRGGRRCGACGYDLRASPAGRCPECGSETAARRVAPAAGPGPVRTLVLLAAMGLSGAMHTIVLRGVLSLG